MSPEDTMARNLVQKHLSVPRERANVLIERLTPEQRNAIRGATKCPLGPGSTIRRIVLHGPQPEPARYRGPGRRVRLRRIVPGPGGTGPFNGQAALQAALGQRDVPWLAIGGRAHPDDLLWFWCWDDIPELLDWDAACRPWVAGPNILFTWSSRPLVIHGERRVCESPHCRLLFTESAWYANLIRAHQRLPNTAPIVLWSYPIDPRPDGPLPAEWDLLVYVKSGDHSLAEHCRRRYARTKVLRYGQFRREELFDAARRSRACLYLSVDDRGPLALAEILLAGCPAVGVERGAPWIEPGRTGIRLDNWGRDSLIDAIEDAMEFDREAVRAVALEKFATDRQVDAILAALEVARQDGRD